MEDRSERTFVLLCSSMHTLRISDFYERILHFSISSFYHFLRNNKRNVFGTRDRRATVAIHIWFWCKRCIATSSYSIISLRPVTFFFRNEGGGFLYFQSGQKRSEINKLAHFQLPGSINEMWFFIIFECLKCFGIFKSILRIALLNHEVTKNCFFV